MVSGAADVGSPSVSRRALPRSSRPRALTRREQGEFLCARTSFPLRRRQSQRPVMTRPATRDLSDRSSVGIDNHEPHARPRQHLIEHPSTTLSTSVPAMTSPPRTTAPIAFAVLQPGAWSPDGSPVLSGNSEVKSSLPEIRRDFAEKRPPRLEPALRTTTEHNATLPSAGHRVTASSVSRRLPATRSPRSLSVTYAQPSAPPRASRSTGRTDHTTVDQIRYRPSRIHSPITPQSHVPSTEMSGDRT